ncbi:MAG: pentapeptide repeat-containing protein [Rothia mucilaginosa]|uniref:Pentapeptide repeat-containing protein n=1 Tax=Rothia mucilaginosa TaxID=43675 RepID=A0A930L8V4_9MICC|nr:pentapeptide repeat-containing protein [Rothia mucilaginosa]MBF1659563.1 pentapeptide repeat-containing protein [Rothia mucilaginosa]
MPLSPIQPKPDATPPDTNDEKATIHNFLANKSCVNWTLFAVVLIFTGAAIYFYIQAQNISHEHLNKTQQLLQEIKEGRDATNETIKEIDSLRNTFSIYGLRLILSLIILVSCFSKPIMKLLNEYPQRVFVSTIALGGILAFSIPQYLYSFKYIGETKDITTSLLTVTGGILAVFTLLKTHQKNETDEKKFEYEKIVHDEQKKGREEDAREQKRQFNKTIKQESYKFYKERIRQVHAERRSRYTKAIEQLADDKGPIRLGGVHSLVGLIDEWLNDNDITDETRMKEGQVIINNLCSYIRSPFIFAENREIIEKTSTLQVYPGNLNEDKAKLREEQEIRQTIFSEISVRLANLTENSSTDKYWIKFNYNFSKSNIFYNLNELTFCNPNFSNTEFNGPANFTGSRFLGKALFKNAIFNSEAYMSDSKSAKTIFEGDADFTGSFFKGKATFKNATFNSLAHFSDFDSAKTTFESEVDFTGASFIGDAIFRNTTFTLAATFSSEYSSRTSFEAGSDFSLSIFSHNANFSNVDFHQYSNFELTSFGGLAKFVKTNFYGPATFSIWGGPQYSQDYSFSEDAYFTDAYFKEGASFTERYFEKSAVFRNAIFEGPAYFAEGKITNSGIFKNAIFKDSSRFILYNFGTYTDFKDAQFSADKAHEFGRTQNIVLGSVPIGIGIKWPQNPIPTGSCYGFFCSWASKPKCFITISGPAK